MKFVFLIGPTSGEGGKLEEFNDVVISAFWEFYYGVYQRGDLPPQVAKQYGGRKGKMYDLTSMGIEALIVPIYQDGQLVLITLIRGDANKTVEHIRHLLQLSQNPKFWTDLVDCKNIISVKLTVAHGQEIKQNDLGMDKKAYDNITKEWCTTTDMKATDIMFVYAEDKLPFTTLHIYNEPDFSKNPWVLAMQKALSPMIVKFAIGINEDNDPGNMEDLMSFSRNIRQAIMLVACCDSAQQFSRQVYSINETEKGSYARKHGK